MKPLRVGLSRSERLQARECEGASAWPRAKEQGQRADEVRSVSLLLFVARSMNVNLPAASCPSF
eukprot:2968450-Pleurochrysis_carterae.AAC.1